MVDENTRTTISQNEHNSNNNTSSELRVLPDSPTDGITCLKYLKGTNTKNKLASTSWDGCVRIYDTASKSTNNNNNTDVLHAMDSGPLLCLDVTETIDAIIVGGMDGSIRLFELGSLTPLLVGKHYNNTASMTNNSTSDEQLNNSTNYACSCVKSLSGLVGGSGSQLIASAGWHSTVHIWDTRQQDEVIKIQLNGKAYTIDYNPTLNLVAIGTSTKHISFIDIRYIHTPNRSNTSNTNNTSSTTSTSITGIDTVKLLAERESSLKYPLRCLKFFPNTNSTIDNTTNTNNNNSIPNSIAIGSIEGRVAIEYLDDIGYPSSTSSTTTTSSTTSTTNDKKFAFKCHRQGEFIYPVNCIEFHPRFGTFATGGCDGVVVLWDGLNKKKLTTLPKFPTSIASLAFNYNGTELAIASSYTFEEGEREHPKDEIYIKHMLDSECKPKLK